MEDVFKQAAEFLESVFTRLGLHLRVTLKQGLTGQVLDIDGADAELVQSQTEVTTNLIALYRALGGGWGAGHIGSMNQPAP